MALLDISFSSNNALEKMNSMRVIVPEKREGPFPVLYLLHGLSDDHTAWNRRTNIERYVEWLPIIVVMPNGERGWYSNSVTDPKRAHETNIIRDVIPFVDSTFRTIAKREGRAIAGLSMGGYGAVKLALKYPQMFCAVAGFSGAYDHEEFFAHDTYRSRELLAIFTNEESRKSNSVFELASGLAPQLAPAISIDCGTEDGLIQHSRRLHAHLTDLGIVHEYAEYPGAHDWRYWNAHVLQALNFVLLAFGLPQRLDPTDSI